MERENLQILLRCKFTSQSRGDRRRAKTNGGRGTVENTELPGAKQKYKVIKSEIYIEFRRTALKNILPNKKVRALVVPIGRRKQFYLILNRNSAEKSSFPHVVCYHISKTKVIMFCKSPAPAPSFNFTVFFKEFNKQRWSTPPPLEVGALPTRNHGSAPDGEKQTAVCKICFQSVSDISYTSCSV